MGVQVSQVLRIPEKPRKLERFVNYEVAIRERNYDGKTSEFERMEFVDFSKAQYGLWVWGPISRGNEFDNRTICDITQDLQLDLAQDIPKEVGIATSDIIPIYAVALANYHSVHHLSQTARIRNAPYNPKEKEWDSAQRSYLYHIRRGFTVGEFRLFLKIFNLYLKK